MSCNSNYVEYNFPKIRTNESFKGASFQVQINGSPVDLSAGWSAKIEFRNGSPTGDVGLTLEDGDGITFDADIANIEDIEVHPFTAADWYWDLVLTDPTGLRHTWTGGVQPVAQGTTST